MSDIAPVWRPTVAVVGGGYGGARVAKALDDVAEVVLVEPKDAFVHNVAALRALVAPEWLPRIYFPYDNLLARGRVVRDHAVSVDSKRVVTGSGEEIAADYIVLATGSAYPFPGKADAVDTDAAHARYRASHEALAQAGRVLLLGAGPVGLELAGEIKAVWPDKHVTIADMADDILAGPFKPELRAELRRQLDALGVELLLGSPLREAPPTAPGTAGTFTVTTGAGSEVTADIWYRCYGVTPLTGYLADDLVAALTPASFVEVTPELRVTGHDTIFALGDITTLGPPMAGHASQQSEVVAANIRALISGEGELAEYVPMGPAIAVPLGPKGGAGEFPGQDGVVPGSVVADVKGRHMLVDPLVELFGVTR
ncbi:NAD(P)/FAD-dependent oxidoreductase [Sphaerisporangium corydalis]|uniref:NAD(P)/FAD-dependent oxidoreductase n=1 Tax=Sphaerisporangium corydalis TaxID=1441875 RepID=A0ABV9E7G5_9ACTN|nr:FAD-dependent oxidoreductase [Sphaerisporangium corydalis]